MKKYSRVCAYIDLDAIAYNMEQMKKRIGEDGKLIAVIKTDGYGHGAVPLAKMFEEMPYIWGYAVACMGESMVSCVNRGSKSRFWYWDVSSRTNTRRW